VVTGELLILSGMLEHTGLESVARDGKGRVSNQGSLLVKERSCDFDGWGNVGLKSSPN
jgi:hypothetical protein